MVGVRGEAVGKREVEGSCGDGGPGDGKLPGVQARDVEDEMCGGSESGATDEREDVA